MASLKELFRTAIAVMLFLAIASLLHHNAVADKTTNPSPRSFYLTKDSFDGSHALTACAAGYHMASFWEIRDTSNFRYDTTLGQSSDDSGAGPPSNIAGWIRTGFRATTGTALEGEANCNVWTSNSGPNVDGGTVVWLGPEWEQNLSPNVISPWLAAPSGCQSSNAVWCVQN
jgi:hypothetical protein